MKLNEITDKKEPFVVIMLRKLLAKGEKVALVYVRKDGTNNYIGTILNIKKEIDRDKWVEYVMTTRAESVFDEKHDTDVDLGIGLQSLSRSDIRKYQDEFLPAPITALLVPVPGNDADLGGHGL